MSHNFRLLTEVLQDVVRTGRARIDRAEEVEAAFGSIDAFLLAVHHRWRTAFFAHLDALLEDPPDDFDGAVLALWSDPTTGGRGLRALLDAHADRPALATAHEQDRLLVHQDLGVDVPSLGSPVRTAMHSGEEFAAVLAARCGSRTRTPS
jgi:hypothetical protein